MRTGPERLALAKKVAERRRAGRYFPEIADELGISPSYASMLYYDPDGSKERERKNKYAGTCELCGAATSGSNGCSGAPKRCATCAPVGKKVWTRDAVVDAIQRWAREHDGCPPRSVDWKRSDRERGYPAATATYGPGNAFPAWADAVEAAGFPRPRVGKRNGQRHWDSRTEIAAAIAAVSVDGTAPSANDDERLGYAARRYFGSWAAACAAAGITPRRSNEIRPRGTWSREVVVEAIQAAAIGAYPPAAGEDLDLRDAAIYWFGSWSSAVRAAGFKPYPTHSANSPRVRKRRELVASRETPRSERRSRAASRSRAPA